jgi:LPS O-antigen subunit length determinant protein (WzzB/FepE family)
MTSSKSDSNNIFKIIFITFVVIVIAYIIYYLYKKSIKNSDDEVIIIEKTEKSFQGQNQGQNLQESISQVNYKMSNGGSNIEHFSQDQNSIDERNSSNFPKEQLTADELLPNDNTSMWAQLNPSGDGSLKDKNFLQSGYHIGINTVGQTLRNANLQLRSEPPCPQVKVSPWIQSTIEPDMGRKPFEIGGCA